MSLSSQKSSHWQITYFPEEEYQESQDKAVQRIEEFLRTALPPGWKFGDANVEQCPDTRRYHYQGYLKTVYCRGTDVKKAIGDRAHIEKSKNKLAVVNYSNKEDTRVAQVQAPQGVPTPWEYVDMIAKCWNEEEFKEFSERYSDDHRLTKMSEVVLDYVDQLVARDIESGARGVEFIAVNPMFRSAWKKFWRPIIIRNGAQIQALNQTSGTQDAQDAQQATRE